MGWAALLSVFDKRGSHLNRSAAELYMNCTGGMREQQGTGFWLNIKSPMLRLRGNANLGAIISTRIGGLTLLRRRQPITKQLLMNSLCHLHVVQQSQYESAASVHSQDMLVLPS